MSALFPHNLGIGVPRRGFLSRERHRMLERAFMYTHDEMVEGDYIEFGVARGTSLIYAYEVCEKHRFLENVRFMGFDSFQGFPEPQGVDRVFERFKKGEVAFARKIVDRNLKLYGVDWNRVELIAGWYEETLSEQTRNRLQLEKARVVNIDCDMHDSTLLSLRFITKSLVAGSVILFDDWFCYRADPEKGEQAAAKEWLAENPNLTLIPYRSYANAGQSFIVKRNDFNVQSGRN